MPPSWQADEVTLLRPVRGEVLELAERLGIAVAAAPDPTRWQLAASLRGGLELRSPVAMGGFCVEVDPGSGPLARRLRTARRDDPLARAVGLPNRQTPPFVLDATAGFARDAMVLAQLGCRVVALERIPALVLLVSAGLTHTGLGERLRVEHADAAVRLRGLPADELPDVVYLDPMFDESGNAQVKKEMQVCRALAGPPDDTGALLALARAVARQRVVVKRHPRLPPLADGVAFRTEGNRACFDVYLTPSPEARSP